jgi:hypothetical protein
MLEPVVTCGPALVMGDVKSDCFDVTFRTSTHFLGNKLHIYFISRLVFITLEYPERAV